MLLAVLALAIAAGCGGEKGPPRVAVSGSVSLDGQPLSSGVIRFLPTGDTRGPAAAAVIKEGVYELSQSEGPIVGTHRVEIEAADYFGFAIDDEAAFAQNVEKKPSRALKNPVPEIYNRRSTLSVEVVPDGAQTFDFPLTSPGPRTAGR
jgi:hypothetical protein